MDFLEYKSAKNARYLNSKKKGYYVWRTRKDNKVRSRHAKLEGRVFNWDDIPPDGFHPGEDYGCRCKAVPIDDELAYEKLGKVEEVDLEFNLRNFPNITAEEAGIEDPPAEAQYPIESVIVGRFGLGAAGLVLDFLNSSAELNPEQAASLKRFEKSFRKATEIRVKKGPNGEMIFEADVPARDILGSYATYRKFVDKNGVKIKFDKVTYAPNGSVVHTKIKFKK